MINEDMLKEAAAELSEFQLQALHTLEGEHAFSGKFQRKMKRLIHKVDHPIRHVLTNVAAVFVAVIITVSTLLFLSPDVRAAVTKWIMHYSDDCVSCYHHGGDGREGQGVTGRGFQGTSGEPPILFPFFSGHTTRQVGS